MIRIGALLAVATAVTVKREEPSLTEKAAHLLKHPIETLTGDTPHEPKTMKDVCPECNKDRQPPLGEHVKHIIEEAAKTGHASWEAVKDKTVEIIESPIETAKQAVNSYRQPLEDSLGGGSITEIVRNVKDKVVGGPQTGGAWETLTEGVGSVKDKILGVESTSKEKDRYASHYPKAMEEVCVVCQKNHREEQAGGVLHTVKEGMHQASNRANEALNDLTSETANTRHDEAHSRTRRNVEQSPESVERMKDVCPECHKHDKEPTALETATQPLKDLKHTAGAIKDDVTSGVADIVADTAYGVRRGAEGVASVASDAVHGVKRGAEGVASVASDAVHGVKRGAEGVASVASDAVHGAARSAESVASEAAHGVRRGAEGVVSVASDAVHGVKRGVEGAASAASDAAHDLRHETEQVGKRATDAAHHLRHGAEDAAHKASETVAQPLHDLKSGAADVKSKIADAVPDMSWSQRAGAIKDKVVDTMTKPFQSLKGDAEDVAHRATDTEDVAQVDRGIPRHWYSNMMAIKESIDQQFQEVVGNIGKGDGLERVSFVQQNMDKVGNSWVSYMNDNGDEHLDVQLDDADAKSFNPLKALNAARHSNGMPARANLDGVKVQIHRREKPHYYLRTTRILPNGSWTQYENDNGVELVTEGHISKKGVTESAPEKTRPDKHPLLNMFRRTLGLSELADKNDG